MIPDRGNFHTLAILVGAAALSGCASIPGPVTRITINSDPQGAEVIVSGRQIGTTPVPVVLDQVFPMHWTSRVASDVGPGFAFYRRLETVTIKKEGCDPYTRDYTGDALLHDVNVRLKCDPNYKQAPPVSAAPGPASAPAGETVEQRLQQLEDLKKKGLITDDEYRTQRERILNQL
ncbi:MAG: PEGA domain-containing protein [Acidiferrobacterales bacterium]